MSVLTLVWRPQQVAELQGQIARVSTRRWGRGRGRRAAEEPALQLPPHLADDAGLAEVRGDLTQVLDCNIQAGHHCADRTDTHMRTDRQPRAINSKTAQTQEKSKLHARNRLPGQLLLRNDKISNFVWIYWICGHKCKFIYKKYSTILLQNH